MTRLTAQSCSSRRPFIPSRVQWPILVLLLLAACKHNPVAPEPLPEATPSAPQGQVTGCYTSTGANVVGCGTLPSFGDPLSDSLMLAEIQYQAAYWYGIPATVLVLNDCRGANAFAPASERTILFGVNLFRSLRGQGADAAIIGVLAHEWAHRLQFENGWETRPVRPMELEADAFAGFYLGLAKSWAWDQVDSFFRNTFATGDNHFNDPGHHGTPAERLAAARLGFDAGMQTLITRTPVTWTQLHGFFRSRIGSNFAVTDGSSPRSQPEVSDAVRRSLYPRD